MTVVPLDTSVHDRNSFDCGIEPLNRYIRERAASDVRKRAAVCYVLTADEAPAALLGFYTLSNLSVELTDLPDAVACRLARYPHVAATLIGRLAVHSDHTGKRLGEFLLMDALKRALQAADSTASALVVVDPKSEDAAGFYSRYDFKPLAAGAPRLYIPMSTIAALAL